MPDAMCNGHCILTRCHSYHVLGFNRRTAKPKLITQYEHMCRSCNQ